MLVSKPADHEEAPCLPAHLRPSLRSLPELGPLDERGIWRLRAHLERVPDPRSWRARGYLPVSELLICSCVVVSGARTIEEIA